MASINGASPKPGTPSSIRSTNSDYDNLVPQFERPTTGDSTRLYQTLPHRTHGALIRQSSSPGDVLNGPAALSVTPVKSPSYDFNFGTKKPSPVRVTPLSRGSRSPRSDAGSGQSSYRTAASPSTTHAHVPSDQKRVGLTRSLTSPEVLSTPAQGETTAKRGNKKYPKHEQAKMIFLQESCVWGKQKLFNLRCTELLVVTVQIKKMPVFSLLNTAENCVTLFLTVSEH